MSGNIEAHSRFWEWASWLRQGGSRGKAVPTIIGGLRSISMPDLPKGSAGSADQAAGENAAFYPGNMAWMRPFRIGAALSMLAGIALGTEETMPLRRQTQEDIMAIERVKEYFEQFGMADRVQEFQVSSATVELAALALSCEPCRIAKTLSFLAEGRAVLVVAAGDAKIDNHKYKAQFGTKAKMLTPEEVETMVGHAVGGVCPFGINQGVTVCLDESLKRFETVFPACGSANSAIELSIQELERYSGYTAWVDVCKGWGE